MLKSKRKFIAIFLVIFTLLFSVACNNQDNTEKNITVKLGIVSEKYQDDNNMKVKLDIDGENSVDLFLNDKDEYEDIEEDKYYMVTYNKDKEIIFIEKSGFINDIMTKNTEKNNQDKKDLKLDKIQLREAVDLEGFNLIDSYELVEEKSLKISMYTNADKDKDGNFMWDDGQYWKLIVHTDEGDYLLYDNYLQIGQLKFLVYFEDEDLNICLFETSSSGLKLINYEFEKDHNYFEGELEFNANDNVNLIHSSTIY